MSFHAYAAAAAGKDLEPFEYEPEPLGPSDVEVGVTHCGICHTDLHLLNNDWGFTAFPFVPGHEVVGTVVAKGHNVHHLREGQRVGIGYQSGSCGQCEYCSRDMENLCLGMLGTCVNGYGGYSDGLRVHSRFAVPLPEKLSAESAAPLMCGGITVFTPFRVFDVRPGMGVGVIGIGGLGHLALQFASTLGFEVTAFSSSPDKEAHARRFGAHHFINACDPAQIEAVANRFDFLLCTATGDLPWATYLATLKPRGKLCIVGVPPSDIAVPALPLILGQKTICGSPIGSPAEIKEMLEHAASSDVQTQIELFPMTQANEGLGRVRTNQARYRVVLAN